MRKYFLTSAVALMAASNVNAETITNMASMLATVTIERATTITCSPINFGNIIMMKGHSGNLSIGDDGQISDVTSNTILSSTGFSAGVCTDEQDQQVDLSSWTTVEETYLVSENNGVKIRFQPTTRSGVVTGAIDIPEDADGYYQGSITLTEIK